MSLHKGVTVQCMRGRYRIESLVGTGGLGRVWRATSADGSKVAIKEPLSDGPQEQVRVNFEKLRVEAIVLERLTGVRPMLLSQTNQGYDLDPQIRGHVVRFVDVDRNMMPSALVLEFIDGKSMDDEFRSAAPSDYRYIDEYAIKILAIVKALHQINILHRDISPHNLITTPEQDKDPVLVDFGTAKEGFNQLSVSGSQWSQIVKPGYSAPELALGLASPSSDLYSTAATILFMFTGLNPQYLRNSAGDLDEARKSELQKIPRNRLEVLKRALSFHPAERYQTAEDMISALAGRAPVVSVPHLVASGRKFPVRGTMVLGRYHPQCDAECRRKGFSGIPDIAINDPERFVGRHHARVHIGSNGECYIDDLHAVSGTAIRHPNSNLFERLQPGRDYPLRDGDVVALAFSPTKGPYMTVSYHAK